MRQVVGLSEPHLHLWLRKRKKPGQRLVAKAVEWRGASFMAIMIECSNLMMATLSERFGNVLHSDFPCMVAVLMAAGLKRTKNGCSACI